MLEVKEVNIIMYSIYYVKVLAFTRYQHETLSYLKGNHILNESKCIK